MSEFEKELLNKVSPHDRTYNGNELFLGGVLAEHFKDWQPPKTLVEVPKSFDKWYKEIIEKFGVFGKKFAIKNISQYGFGSLLEDVFGETVCDEELLTFANDYESFLSAIIYGYTVEKEQMYYLKNKNTGHILYRQPKEAGGNFIEVVATINEEYTWFTQDEIDELETGSYEQIAVKVED